MLMEDWNNVANCVISTSARFFSTTGEIISGPAALFGFMVSNIFFTPVADMVICGISGTQLSPFEGSQPLLSGLNILNNRPTGFGHMHGHAKTFSCKTQDFTFEKSG